MIRLFGIAVLVASFVQLFGQEKAAPPVQQQLDELKRGQERILQELQELRSALQQAPARAEAGARSPAPAVLNVGGEPFRGATNATVAIVEYSDFDCSHCAQFATESFPQLDQKYIQTGKVKYFFRDLPEPGSAESLLKAKFARCAGEQGKFWQTHDYLFSAKPHLIGSDLSREALIIGLDAQLLSSCLKEERYTTIIQRSANGASRMGFAGTPTFVIGQLTNGGNIVRVKEVKLGVQNFETFENLIEELLGDAPKTKKPSE
jgi:protein-disulfide isomerase